MKIIYFGTSEFAVVSLKALVASKHKIVAVVTAVDGRKGRGRKLGSSPVKIFGQQKGLDLFQPANLKDIKFLQALQAKKADLFVVCAYGKILTNQVLQIPLKYAINLHASLLPKYRGAAPISWAIINGEKETGITVFKMDEHMDRGEVLLQKKAAIAPIDTSETLSATLSQIGAKALLSSLDLIDSTGVELKAQNEKRVSFAPKLKKKDGLINWKGSASEIHNRIRGLQPWPGCFSYLKHKLVKIWGSTIVQSEKDGVCGEITDLDADKGILVQTGENKLMITELQLEGKKRMSAVEFIAGHKIEIGERLGG
ncbi:MAG: methionyl-tRNA formyltransferase [Candidatus Omnitrophica bacterium]|nr:methionyl-tRNA formyltransferase [Candidatus Omnitrophota bacterium]